MNAAEDNVSRNLLVFAAVAAILLTRAAASGQTFDRAAYERAIEKQIAKMDQGVAQGPYEATWESLQKHREVPEWFRDAKFGIYWHWGVYSVPAYGNEWYAKWMHTKEGRRSYYKHHVETYGEPNEFGYHDFVPLFKAERFDAEAWADLLQKAGAKYAGPVCEHHDGFSMWDSDLTPWNAGDVGPKRDLVGQLEKAIRQRGMKFVATFHHERTRSWYPRVEGWPTTSNDPKLQLLYMNIDEELFDKIFQAKLGEVIDKYQPDLIWFDGRLEEIPEPYHLKFLAYYFNQAERWRREVVVTCKGHDYPPEVAIEDFEKGRTNRLTDFCWLTDDTISMGSWCYTQDLEIKPTSRVLHDLIDIVSKNGCLLLNISPKSDGTIPDDQRQVLLGLGRWLGINGEAIYNTRPWLAFGEGPTRLRKSGGFVGHLTYTPQDIRYTRSKDAKTVYAIVLGWPQEAFVTLRLTDVQQVDGATVQLLGRDDLLSYRVNDQKQLVIDVPRLAPAQRPCQHACVLKLSGFELGLNAAAAAAAQAAAAPPARPSQEPVLSRDLILEANEAGLVGPQINVESKIPGSKNIGFWNAPESRAVWKLAIDKAGRYQVAAVVAARSASKLTIEAAGRSLTADVPATGGWDQQQTISFGTVAFDQPGTVELIARPADPNRWKPVNLWKIELTAAP